MSSSFEPINTDPVLRWTIRDPLPPIAMPPPNAALAATPARAGRVAQLYDTDVMDVDLSPASQHGGATGGGGGTPSSQAEDQVIGDILQQAIATGTQHVAATKASATAAGARRPLDVAKDGHLLQVLVRALILDRATGSAPLEQTSRDHILGSLKVFEDRAERAPEVFLTAPADNQDDDDDDDGPSSLPLYKWLIPRLIHAASLYGLCGALDIRRGIEACVVKTMLAVGTGMGPVEESGTVQSLDRMMNLLEGLARGCVALQSAKQGDQGFACLLSDSPSRRLLDKAASEIAFDKTPLYLIPIPLKSLEATSLALSIASVATLALDVKTASVPMWTSMSGRCTSVIARSLSSISRNLQARCAALGATQDKDDSAVVVDMLVSLCRVCRILVGSPAVPAQAASQASVVVVDLVVTLLRSAQDADQRRDPKLHELQVELARCLGAARKSRTGKLGGRMWTVLVEFLAHRVLDRPEVAEQLLTEVMAAVMLPPGGRYDMIALALASADAQHNVDLLCSKFDSDSPVHEEIAEANRQYAIQLKSIKRQTRGVKRKLNGSVSQEENADLSVEVTPSGSGPVAAESQASSLPPPSLGQGEKHAYLSRVKPIVESFGIVLQQGQIRSADLDIQQQVSHYIDLNAFWASATLPAMHVESTALSAATSHVFQVIQRVDPSSGPEAQCITIEALRAMACLYCLYGDCRAGCSHAQSSRPTDRAERPHVGSTIASWSKLVKALDGQAGRDSADVIHSMLLTLRNAIRHQGGDCRALFPLKGSSSIKLIVRGFEAPNRRTRMLTAQCLADLHLSHSRIDGEAVTKQIAAALDDELTSLNDRHPSFQEAMLLALSDIAKRIEHDSPLFGTMLELLMLRLGSANPAMQALARLELTAILKHQDQRPYALISPYFPTLAPKLVRSDARGLAKACAFLGIDVAAFVVKTLSHTLPVLVLEGDRAALSRLAGFAQQALGTLLIEQIHTILAAIVLQDSTAAVERSTAFLCNLINSLKRSPTNRDVTIDTLVSTCVIPFLVEIVVQLGDPQTESRAERALQRAQVFQSKSRSRRPDEDLGSYLKPHMLGIISFLNDLLQETQGRKTTEEKCKVIRSFGKLIEHVGDSIMLYSPHVRGCAALKGGHR